MAQEAPNILHAGVNFLGINPGEQINRSRGVIESTFVRAGPGLYNMTLVEAVDPFAVVCTAEASDVGGVPLIAFASIFPVGDQSNLGVTVVDHAGAPADAANVEVAVFKFQTEG